MRSIRARLQVLALALACGQAATILAQPSGPEFRVNTFTTNRQYFPAAAADSTGNFVVVWQSYLEDGDDAGVYAQRYSVAGAPLGGPFRVNSTTTGAQTLPQVASDSSGNFVVVWQSTDYPQAFGQRYASSGAPLGGEFPINTSGSAGSPAVASSPTGSFVIVWTGTGYAQITGQRFDSSGAPVGANFPVTSRPNLVHGAKVASDSTGNFVVVFVENGGGGYPGGIVGRRFGSTGAPLGSEFQIDTYTSGIQVIPAVASAGSGNFVVTWYDEIQGGGHNFARRFASTGEPLTGEFRFDTSTQATNFPSVASDAAGNFVASWASFNGGVLDVYARSFSSTGAPIGTAFAVNSYTINVQSTPAVAFASSGGKFTVTWSSVFQDGSETGIYARRFVTATACSVGDVNWDGSRDVADVFYLINTLFAGGPPPLCSGDVNGSGTADVADVFYLINYLFAGGPAPV